MARICELTGARPGKGSKIWRSGEPKREGGIGTHVTAVTKRRFFRTFNGSRPSFQRGSPVYPGERQGHQEGSHHQATEAHLEEGSGRHRCQDGQSRLNRPAHRPDSVRSAPSTEHSHHPDPIFRRVPHHGRPAPFVPSRFFPISGSFSSRSPSASGLGLGSAPHALFPWVRAMPTFGPDLA